MSGDDALLGVEHAPGVSKPDAVVVVDDVRRSFGGLQAVDVDHLEMHADMTKVRQTLFNLLSGFDKPDSGEWHLNGGPLVGIPSYGVARRGMVRTFQLTRTMPRLTVLENMLVGEQNNSGESIVASL